MALRVPPEPLWYVFPIARFDRSMTEAAGSLPVTFTSWYRDPVKNADEGGDVYSQHLAGLALDVEGPVWALRVLATAVQALGFIAVMESDHLHIQMFPAGFLAGLQTWTA